jgi:regulator of protease activity HflC (stomatin/prohibitin superfamily)
LFFVLLNSIFLKKGKIMRKRSILVFIVTIILAGLVLSACEPVADMEGNVSPEVKISETLTTDYLGGSIFWLIVTLVILGAGIFLIITQLTLKRAIKIGVIVGSVLIFLLLQILIGGFVTIDQGEVGVHLRLGAAIQPLRPGAHFILPYVDQVVVFSTRDWTYGTMSSDKISTASEDFPDYPVDLISKDNVQTDVTYTIQGRLNAEMAVYVYERYGTLRTAISQAVKNPSRIIVRQRLSGFEAREIYIEVDNVDGSVTRELSPIMNEAGLILVRFGFKRPTLGINGDYEQQLNAEMVAKQQAAVEEQKVEISKQQAAQAVETAKGAKGVAIQEAEARAAATLAEQEAIADAALYSSEQEAKQVKLAADAEAYQINAIAEAQATANNLIANSVSPILIDYLKWTNWDGALPKYVNDLNNLLMTIE